MVKKKKKEQFDWVFVGKLSNESRGFNIPSIVQQKLLYAVWKGRNNNKITTATNNANYYICTPISFPKNMLNFCIRRSKSNLQSDRLLLINSWFPRLVYFKSWTSTRASVSTTIPMKWWSKGICSPSQRAQHSTTALDLPKRIKNRTSCRREARPQLIKMKPDWPHTYKAQT